MRYLWIVLLAGCVTEPEPDYCYKALSNNGTEVWVCEGHAQFPRDTLPDSEKP